MSNSLKSRFNAISQKIICMDELHTKIETFQDSLTASERTMMTCNDMLKLVTVGFGTIAKDMLGLPANTGLYEDAKKNAYITGKQFKKVYLSMAFNKKLSEGLLSIAEQCQDHCDRVQSGQLKKYML